MRSSDQRYFQVRRAKRITLSSKQYADLAHALRDARSDPSKVSAADRAIRDSAEEFTHVMLVCGRTANDFRRNFRRGCAEFHVVTATQLVPYEILRVEKLDGYSLLRLTREQHWNVKKRWAKLREQDALLHDPQGAFWTKVVHATLKKAHEDHISILADIRDGGLRPVSAKNVSDGAVTEMIRVWSEHGPEAILSDPDKYSAVAERSVKQLQRAVRRQARQVSELLPEFSETAKWNMALGRLKEAWDYMRVLNGTAPSIPADLPVEARIQIRLLLEESLVVAEAYVCGGDVREALFDPDTSQRHCSDARLLGRFKQVFAWMTKA